MREILFRGKRVDNGEWVEGYLLCYYGYTTIITKDDCAFAYTSKTCYDGDVDEVIPETVGQYTGFCDKNGKRIFEGDILSSVWGYNGVVEFDRIMYAKCVCLFNEECEIIGNIHDNPELLKGGAE